jgi:hypothetical protein
MGLFWDLMQQSQISDQKSRASSLEGRVEELERELHQTRTVLFQVIERLEQRLGEDLDGDGRIG